MAVPVYVGVVGASQATPQDMEDGEAVGRLLAERGAYVVCGGRGGVMAAVSKGCAEARGTVIGMLPGDDRGDANQWVSVAIPTGLGELRNGLIVRTTDVLISIGGAYGTLSEVALGLQAGRRVFGLHSWNIEGITPVSTPLEAVEQALAVVAGS